MFGMNWLKTAARALLTSLVAVVLVLGLVSCGDRLQPSKELDSGGAPPARIEEKISEVSPPSVIQELGQTADIYRPQVAILSPQPEEVLSDTTVKVRLQVRDLPVFKNPELELGPHLAAILDNQTAKEVYDLNQPLVFEDLPPGTHTLRVFASRPWHESYKNEGAYAQTTFHIFAKTSDNTPDPAQPLLTYNRPTGTYGAEPVMLDFYLTNAPLHLAARENPDDEIADWRIRVTVNGQSFVLDRWQPIYLKGFKTGKNWVQLEFLDEQGNPVKNAFNNTVRLIAYDPKAKDTLSQLVRGELSAAALRGIVDPNYIAAPPAPEPTPAPAPEPTPAPAPAPAPEPTPAPQPAPQPALTPEVPAPVPVSTPEPQAEVTPEVPAPAATPEATADEESSPNPETAASTSETVTAEAKEAESETEAADENEPPAEKDRQE